MQGRSESRVVASESHVRLYVRSKWGTERTTKDCVDVSQLQGVYVRVEKMKHEGQPVWAGPIDPRLGYSIDNPGPCRVYSAKNKGGKLIYVVCDNPGMSQKGGLPGLLKSSDPHNGKLPYAMRDWRVANMARGDWVPTPDCPLLKVDFKTRLYISSRHKPNVQGLYDLVDLQEGKPVWGYSTFRLWHDSADQRWALSELVHGVDKKLIRSDPVEASRMPMSIRIWKIACAIREAWVPGDFQVEIVDVGTSMGSALRSTTARVDEMKQALSRQMIRNAPKFLEVVCPSVPKYDGKFELFGDEKHNGLPIWRLGDKRVYCGMHGHWQFTEHASGMAHGTAGIRSTEPNMGDLPHQAHSWSVAEKTKPGAPRSWRILADIAVIPVGTASSNEEALQRRVKELVGEVKKLRAVEGSGFIETYENQRWLPVKGWGTMMLPTDRPIWSRENGKGGLFPKDDATPPKNCEWDGDWAFGTEGAGKNGWMFASDFPDHGVHFKFQPKRGPTCCVRRRRWFRKYKPIDTDDEPATKEAAPAPAPAKVDIIDVDEVGEDEEEKLAVTTRSVLTTGSAMPSEHECEARGLLTAHSMQSNEEDVVGKRVSLLIPMERSVFVPTESSKSSDDPIEEEDESEDETSSANEPKVTPVPPKDPDTSEHSTEGSDPQQVCDERKRAVLQLIETELQDLGADDKTTLERLSRVRRWIEALETPVTGTPTEQTLPTPPIDLSPRVAEALQRLKDEVTALKEPESIGRKRSKSGVGIAEAAGLLAWEVASSRRALAVTVLGAAAAAALVDASCLTLCVPDSPTHMSTQSQGLTPSVTMLSLSRNSSLPRHRARLQRPPPLQPLEAPTELCLKPDEILLDVPDHWKGPASTPGLSPSVGASALSTPVRTPRRRRSWRNSSLHVPKVECNNPSSCVVLCAAIAVWWAQADVKHIIRSALLQQHGSMRGVAAYMNGLSSTGDGGEGILHHTMSRAGVGRYVSHVLQHTGSGRTWDVVLWLECPGLDVTRQACVAAVIAVAGVAGCTDLVPVLSLPLRQTVSARTLNARRYSPRTPVRGLSMTWNSVPRMRTVPDVNTENSDVAGLLMLRGECPMLSSERLISALKASVSQRLVCRLSSVKDIKVTRSECHATAGFVVEHGGDVGLQMLQRATGWLLRGVSGRWTVVGVSACLVSDLSPCPLGHATEPLATPSADTQCDSCRTHPWGSTVTQAFGCVLCGYSLCPSCTKPAPRRLPKRGASTYTRIDDLIV